LKIKEQIVIPAVVKKLEHRYTIYPVKGQVEEMLIRI